MSVMQITMQPIIYNKMLTCQIIYNSNNQGATRTPCNIFTILQLLLKHITKFIN